MSSHVARLLDLFCGAGGAAMGYHRAGFDVVGVDIEPQPSYPFPFIQEDVGKALQALYEDGEGLYDGQRAYYLDDFAAIHASPPCQAYSRTQRLHRKAHPELIEPVRAYLQTIGLAYVIENVEDAPLIEPITLCGSMFGLDVRRHRLFETSFPIWLLPSCQHGSWTNRYPTHARKDKAQFSPVVHIYGTGGGAGKNIDLWRWAMDVPWMQTKAEIAEAIPPAYTEFIGRELGLHINDGLPLAAVGEK